MRFLATIPVFASLALFAGEARAHLDLTSPTPRTTSLKSGPCGAGPNDPRGPTVATFMPGEEITVTWNEYIDHPGHYRISFDDDGQDIFFNPKDFNDVSGGPGVLMDGIADKNGGDYSQKVVLPNIECDNCVLQVIQMMTDKAPYGDGNDIYYQCADIALVGVVQGTTTGDTSSTTDPGTTGEPGTTAEPGTTGEPGTSDGTTAGGATGGTAEPGGSTGGAQPTTGATDGTAASSDGATGGGSTDGSDDDGGCGCRSGEQGGLGWLMAGLLLPLLRRRRA